MFFWAYVDVFDEKAVLERAHGALLACIEDVCAA